MTEVEVRGGVGGLEVQYDGLAAAARRLAGDGADLLVLAADRHRLLLDGDLLASAALHPSGFGRVEAALLKALDGGSGVGAAALRLELRAGQLLVAVARYRAADVLGREADELRSWLLGATAPVTLPLAAVSTLGWSAAVLASGGDPLEELEQALLAHPGVVEDLTAAVGGLTAPLRAGLGGPLPVLADEAFRAVTGEALLPRDLAEAAGLLALLYAPAAPRVGPPRPDASPAAALAPTGVADLLVRLDHRNQHAAAGTEHEGDIGVTRIVTQQADGTTSVGWVVDLPGTKDWQFVPGPRPGVNDLATNLELTAGHPNARLDALDDVLRAAGVRRDDPVMLVGHSQGGMLAVRAATELRGQFTVTHVVTAGSPVGGMPVPPDVQVLSLENRRDVVPYVDGRPNDDAAQHVTVLFDSSTGSVGGNHALDSSYLPAARELDRSDETSVRAWLEGAGVFFAEPGERVAASTTVHAVTGAAPPESD